MDSEPVNFDMPPAMPPTRKPFQYSLRTLMELTAVAGLGCSLRAWGGEAISRTPEFFAGLLVVLIAFGIYMRRWTLILAVAVVLAGLLLGLSYSQHKAGKTVEDAAGIPF
jgi:hypothetical protein